MENLKKSVGIRAQAIRERLGFKNRELFAEVLDVHSNTVGQLERGTTWLSPEMVLLYRNKLGVDPAEFLSDKPVVIQPTPKEALAIIAKALEKPLIPDFPVPEFTALNEKERRAAIQFIRDLHKNHVVGSVKGKIGSGKGL